MFIDLIAQKLWPDRFIDLTAKKCGSKNNKTKLKLEKDYGSIVTVYKCTEKISNDIWATIL